MSATNSQAGKLQAPPVMTVRIGIYLLGLLLLVSFIMGVVKGASVFLSGPADPSTEGLKPLGVMFLFGAEVIIAAPQAFFLYMAHRRHLWALVLAIAVNVIQFARDLYAVSLHGIGSYWLFAYWLAGTIAIVFLLVPPSFRWFKGRDSNLT